MTWISVAFTCPNLPLTSTQHGLARCRRNSRFQIPGFDVMGGFRFKSSLYSGVGSDSIVMVVKRCMERQVVTLKKQDR